MQLALRRRHIQILEELDKNNSFWFAAWLVIVRREFLLENALFFEKGILHEDERWVPLVFANAKTAKMFDDAFYMYRTNGEGSIVSSPRIKREFDKISTAEYLYQYSTNKKSATRLLKRRAASLIFGCVLSLKHYSDNKEFTKLLEKIKKCTHNDAWKIHTCCFIM